MAVCKEEVAEAVWGAETIGYRQAVAKAARELNDLREGWLNPDNASAAELKKRTLTNLYNQRPTGCKWSTKTWMPRLPPPTVGPPTCPTAPSWSCCWR